MLELVEHSEFVYILETNGMTIGHDPKLSTALSRFKNLHVRVSIKGSSPAQFHELTGARPDSYWLPYRAMERLIDEKISCNACLMASFSDEKDIETVKQRLLKIHPGILRSLETESITLFPKVKQRLKLNRLTPLRTRNRAK
ncbi:MAG: hypothetical protein CMD83_10895 [Gammaproteobacteria bacterium]|nr:hypothetical protein [Gammaproteobacteria bacterium]